MRTIKFKGKCIKDDSWVFGDLCHVMNYVAIKPFRRLSDVRLLILAPFASSPASSTGTARRFMRVTYLTEILKVR